MNARKKQLILICAIILALGIGAFALMLQGSGRIIPGLSSSAPSAGTGLEYQGKWYPYRKDLQTILIMGLDKYERPEDSWGYLNNQQADFLILLVVDTVAGKCNVLHLNRDTMTQITRLGVSGDQAGTFLGQLALAHTYGSGGSDSCLNAVKAVSEFLCDVKIDHYLTVTMKGVELLTDYVGGVEVEILDDFTDIDPSMEQGKTMMLNGSQALAYVRTRSILQDSSNLRRMERQRQFMNALYQTVIEKKETDSDFLMKAVLKLSDTMMSDCTTGQMESLMKALESCTLQTILPLEGQAVKGEEFMEFYVDEASLKTTVISLFCK